MQAKSRGREEASATTSRNFRTFLLLAQLESREIGQRIAEARRVAGMTQEEVADLLGVSVRSVQGYEAGEVVPYRHFQRLEQILGRSLDWFLHGEERPEDDRFRRIVQEELASVREAVERVEHLLGEPSPRRRGKAGAS